MEDPMTKTAEFMAKTDRRSTTAAESRGRARAERPAEDEFGVIPVRLRQSQLRLLEIAAESASCRLGQDVSLSTIIAALITKYRDELAAEADARERH
jgi:hypothetical protein